MQRPISRPIGAPVEALDTPALLVDLDKLDANISAFNDEVRARGKTLRAQVFQHKTPAIAHRQTVDAIVTGIAVRSVSEAEIFAQAGLCDILIMRPLVTKSALNRVMALRNRIDVTFNADPSEHEISAGSYALEGAVTVSARVTSRPEPRRAISDCGQKAIGNDLGGPAVVGHAELIGVAGSAEHGMAIAAIGEEVPFAIGDWFELVPGDASTAFNLHDVAYGVRAGVLEVVFPISARGAYT